MIPQVRFSNNVFGTKCHRFYDLVGFFLIVTGFKIRKKLVPFKIFTKYKLDTLNKIRSYQSSFMYQVLS